MMYCTNSSILKQINQINQINSKNRTSMFLADRTNGHFYAIVFRPSVRL